MKRIDRLGITARLLPLLVILVSATVTVLSQHGHHTLALWLSDAAGVLLVLSVLVVMFWVARRRSRNR